MRVLLINSVCGIKSTGRIVADIAEKYSIDGHTCKIAYGREEAPEKYREITYRIGSDFNVKVNALKARIYDNEGFNAKKETKKFLEWADDYNPDLLWIHNLHGYYINVDMLFAWIKTRPQMKVKWTLHDCWAFTGHCAHFTMAECGKWKTQCMNCVQKKLYPASFLIDASENNYKKKKKAFCGVKRMTIITPSQWLADLVKQSFLKEYTVEVKHNTINADIFKPTISDFRKQNHLEGKKIILGVATSWTESKGLYDFICLAELLDDTYKIVLVGMNKKQMKLLPSNILSIERTNNAVELAEIYSAADVFVNLTYEDTYPTVNLEAQACGTPCITYRTGGSPECVPEKNVVDVGNLRMLVERIYEICSVHS